MYNSTHNHFKGNFKFIIHDPLQACVQNGDFLAKSSDFSNHLGDFFSCQKRIAGGFDSCWILFFFWED